MYWIPILINSNNSLHINNPIPRLIIASWSDLSPLLDNSNFFRAINKLIVMQERYEN